METETISDCNEKGRKIRDKTKNYLRGNWPKENDDRLVDSCRCRFFLPQ